MKSDFVSDLEKRVEDLAWSIPLPKEQFVKLGYTLQVYKDDELHVTKGDRFLILRKSMNPVLFPEKICYQKVYEGSKKEGLS